MSIANVTFRSRLATVELLEAVIKFGIKAEGILLEDFVVDFDWNDNRFRLTVPEGYAATPSVPGWARSFVPATGPIRWASFPHDFLYEFHSVPRSVADDLFLAIMVEAGLGRGTRWRAWAAVRLGGWVPWLRHKGEVTLKGLAMLHDDEAENQDV